MVLLLVRGKVEHPRLGITFFLSLILGQKKKEPFNRNCLVANPFAANLTPK